MRELTPTEVMALRIHAQELDRDSAARAPTEVAILDLGVQDTGRDAASWALANRGVRISTQQELYGDEQFALAWTLRGAPHFYRRAELPDVLTAVSPYSDADAGKRLIGAAAPLEAAGIGPREGLAEIAREMRAHVDRPRVKGEVSTWLSGRLSDPYLRDCRRCDATHPWELPFRFAALCGGLELEPGTSPPILRRVDGWPRRPAGPALDPTKAPERLQPIRAYLRLLGPATPQQVAGFLDGSVADVRRLWPDDAVEVRVDGKKAWILSDPSPPEVPTSLVRLLGPFDLLLQAKDRSVIVPDRVRHKTLWPALGRPGAVLVGADLVGTWRPRASGSRFSIQLQLWTALSTATRARIEEQAERLAAHRGLALAGVTGESS